MASEPVRLAGSVSKAERTSGYGNRVLRSPRCRTWEVKLVRLQRCSALRPTGHLKGSNPFPYTLGPELVSSRVESRMSEALAHGFESRLVHFVRLGERLRTARKASNWARRQVGEPGSKSPLGE